MTEEESRPLIEWLALHQVRPEFTCRVRWTPGTLTIWDNRCTQHNAVNDYPRPAPPDAAPDRRRADAKVALR
jgi:taurine dioxygenase